MSEKVQLALECPTKMLDMVQPFANFDFILAHKVLEDEEYKEYFKNSNKSKMLDNSVNEIGKPLGLEELGKAAEMVGCKYIVAPDFPGHREETISSYVESVEKFGEGNVLGVLQGASMEDALDCLDYMKGMVCIPYDIGSSKDDPPWVMALRRLVVVLSIPNDRPIHLLGFNSLDEFTFYSERANIISIDTGVPIMLGLLGKDILDPLESKRVATHNIMDTLKITQQTWTAVIRNIALLRRYIS